MPKAFALILLAVVVTNVASGAAGRATGVTANVFVAPNGNDGGSSCHRFAPAAQAPSPATACATVAQALSLAQPGDVVQLLPGSYGPLLISRQSGADTPKVVVRGDPGLPQQQRCAAGCKPGNVIVSDVDVCGHGLSIQNLDTSAVYAYVYVGARACPGTNTVTADHDIALVNVHFNAGTLRGHALLLKGSRIGPNEHICDNGQGSNREDNLHIWPDTRSSPYTAPYDVTLDGNLIYDAVMSTPGCDGAHADLIQTLGYNRLTIENNIFWRPGHSFIQDGLLGGTKVGNAVIRNNFFGGPSAPGGGYTHLGNPDPGPNCVNGPYVIENNTWATGGLQLSCADQVSTLRNNYLFVSANTHGTCGAGNWDHNVFDPSGVTCGTNAKRCKPQLLWPSAGSGDFTHGPDLHVAATDRCLRGAGTVAAPGGTRRDLDGDTRPARTPVDVGADQWETALIVPQHSIGRAALGSSQSAVEAFYGRASLVTRPLATGRPPVQVASYRLFDHALWVAFANHVVVGVGTSSTYYSGLRGVGVGSSAASAVSAIGGHWLACRSAVVATRGGAVTQLAARGRSAAVNAVSIVRRAYAAAPLCK
jgi:hypothetical protein